MIRAFVFSALALLPVASPAAPLPKGCGTARAIQEWIDGGAATAPKGASARTLATKLHGRTYYTANFALHYAVGKTVHQVRWTPADSSLRRLRDSLYTAFAGDAARRDSLLHDALDSLDAPHPAYIVKAAEYFERARAHYGDTLGMSLPDSSLSEYFQRPPRGRYSVDFVNIDTLTGYDETYGLTNRPPNNTYGAPMLIENDFLYNTRMPTADTVTGTPIVARYNNQVLHDYSVDWDDGLAVTIPHEYYHAVQFRYTSHLLGNGYHAWYELSAVGMEERLAPHVNDYFQYLRHVIPYTGTVSLLTRPPSLQNYGNGIFHIYLTHKVGKHFDAVVWDSLRNNGNNLPKALTTAFGSTERWDSLYTAYAAAIAIAGRPGAGASPLAFSPDMAEWPRPVFDSALAQPVTQATLSPLTFRLIRPTVSGTTWASLPGMRGGWRVTEDGTQYAAQFLPDSILPVSAGALAVTVANASPTATRLMKLSRAAAGLSAYPNPARANAGAVNFSAPVPGSTASLTVVSESGRRVATIAPVEGAWTWDLRDGAGRAVPPGVYYYAISGEAPQTLLLLP